MKKLLLLIMIMSPLFVYSSDYENVYLYSIEWDGAENFYRNKGYTEEEVRRKIAERNKIVIDACKEAGASDCDNLFNYYTPR